jgi:hypothetical protein
MNGYTKRGTIVEHVLRFVQTKSVPASFLCQMYCARHSIPRHGVRTPHAYSEADPDDMQFQQDGMPSQFYKEVTDFLNKKFPVKQIDWGGLSLGHPTQLILLALLFFVAVHHGHCIHATTDYRFDGTRW